MLEFKIIRTFLEHEAPDLAQQVTVEVRWVDQPEIQRLNRRYRHVDRSTDILSFPLYSYRELQELRAQTKKEPILLGSLVLCKVRIQDHAAQEGVSYDEQVVWSIRHGLKHLLGYDHDEAGESWQPITNT